ncbi:hypothetical protein T190115A13A_100120 [Tenacibaculum sp. 190524A02b]|uniref:Uncharacterized protein n=1 Tax=Tenacibaculum vairaonense TaxID=3137860 RepID=A0ABP1F8Z2_9FLAO
MHEPCEKRLKHKADFRERATFSVDYEVIEIFRFENKPNKKYIKRG